MRNAVLEVGTEYHGSLEKGRIGPAWGSGNGYQEEVELGPQKREGGGRAFQAGGTASTN